MWNRQEIWKAFLKHKYQDAPRDDKFTHTTKITRELYDKLNRGEITDPETKNFVEFSIKKVFEKYNHGQVTNENEKQYICNLSKEIKEKYLTESVNNFDNASDQALLQLMDTVSDIRSEFIPLPHGMVPLTMYLIEDFRTFLSQNVNFDYGNYSVAEEGSEAWTLGVLKAMRDIHWQHATESDACQLYTRHLRMHSDFNDVGLQRLNELDQTIISTIVNHEVAHLSARKELMGKLVIQKMENSNSDILQRLAEKALLNYGDFFGHDLMDFGIDLAVGFAAF